MPVVCPNCREANLHLSADSGTVECRHCDPKRGRYDYQRFPAYLRERKPLVAQKATLEDAATCFNHPDKLAVAVCVSCGIFICPLCLVEEPEGPLCLDCFNRKITDKANNEAGANSRVAYDSIALALAILPIIFFYLTIITAPIVIYMVIRYWKKHPCSEVPRTRIRFYLAFFIALLQIAGWVLFFIAMSASNTF